ADGNYSAFRRRTNSDSSARPGCNVTLTLESGCAIGRHRALIIPSSYSFAARQHWFGKIVFRRNMKSVGAGSYKYSSSFLRSFGPVFSLIVVLGVTLALTATPLTAQTNTGALRGRVTDPSGAVIPDATVTAIAADGKKTTVTTNHSGIYEIKALAPGKYTVSAVAKGFAVHNEVDVNVPAGPAQPFDIALGIEVEQQQVTVQDEANTVGLSPTEN